jgi:hypothetical protein
MNKTDSVLSLITDNSVNYFATLSLSVLNRWMMGQLMNSKGFWREWRWPNRGTRVISVFAWRNWENRLGTSIVVSIVPWEIPSYHLPITILDSYCYTSLLGPEARDGEKWSNGQMIELRRKERKVALRSSIVRTVHQTYDRQIRRGRDG